MVISLTSNRKIKWLTKVQSLNWKPSGSASAFSGYTLVYYLSQAAKRINLRVSLVFIILLLKNCP